MANPNAPEAANESSVPKKGENIHGLLGESIRKEFGTESGMISPIKWNTYRQDSAVQDIIKRMQDIRSVDSDFEHISDSEIQGLKQSEILASLFQYAQPLKNARKKALNRLKNTFPELGGLQLEEIEERIDSLNEKQLSDVYTSRNAMYRFFHDEFRISRSSLEVREYDFLEIFSPTDLPENLRKQVEYAALQYKKNSIPPSVSLVRELLGFYSSPEKKKEICEYFNIQLSLPDALRLGLVNQDFVENLAKTEYAAIWDQLEKPLRDKLISSLKGDDGIHIDIDDIESGTWTRFSGGKGVKDVLVSRLFQAASMKEGRNNDGSIMSKVQLDKDGKIHGNWLHVLQDALRSNNGNPKIQNFTQFTPGSILSFSSKDGKKYFFQLDQVDVPMENEVFGGLTLSVLNSSDSGETSKVGIGKAKGESTLSYEEFSEFLLHSVTEGEVISSAELDTQIQNNPNIVDNREKEDEQTLEYLQSAIDKIDPKGKEVNDGKIEPGLVFVSKGVNKDGDEIEQTYTIVKLSPPEITLSNGYTKETALFSDFVSQIEKYRLERIAQVSPEHEDESFLHALHAFGVDHHAELKNGEIHTEHEHEVDDGHGHTHKEKVKGKYEFFKDKESDAHIRFAGMKDGLVTFGEWTAMNKIEKVQEAKKNKKLSQKEEKKCYRWTTIPYAEFLSYLKKNKLEATTDNLLDPHAGHEYHPHDPHFEGSIFSKMGKMWNLHDIIKGIGNLTHHVEHYFEKTSKLNASRFTLAMAKKLNLPADLIAQAQSEEVGSVKEIIEKLKDKLFNLNGPHARTKALHIAHNADARPEEVAAAMLYMVKSYGHLYAEDIAYAQGSESFFNGFLNACGFRDKASRDAMKEKSRKKFLSDMGSEPGAVIQEEELIWGFMKTMDGNYEQYPLAGTVVKAMGGPSGWEKAWRTEGFEGAYEKGKRQGGDTVNADGRVNKGLSALTTHEFVSAIGFIEKAAGKTPDPQFRGIETVWALAGYSQYMGTNTAQKIKGYGDSMGHTYHAFAFLRNYEDNLTYRAVFRDALKDIAPNELDKLDKHIATLQRNNHHDPKDNDKAKDAVNGINEIWVKYHKKGLHDRLQGKNGWLMEQAAGGNQNVKKYIKRLSGIHEMNGGENPPGQDNDWMLQYGYDGSPMFGVKERDKMMVMGLDRTLKKIPMTGSMEMSDDRKDRLWPSVKSRFQNIKKISNDDLRRQQYFQFHEDIMEYFLKHISIRTSPQQALNELKVKSYYNDLQSFGIDPKILIFRDGSDQKTLIKNSQDNHYHNFMKGGMSDIGTINSVADIVSQSVGKLTDKNNRGYTTAVNEERYRQTA